MTKFHSIYIYIYMYIHIYIYTHHIRISQVSSFFPSKKKTTGPTVDPSSSPSEARWFCRWRSRARRCCGSCIATAWRCPRSGASGGSRHDRAADWLGRSWGSVKFMSCNPWFKTFFAYRNTGWWWLEPWNFEWLSIYWEFHHPNWRTPSFFRGVAKNHQPEFISSW